MTIHVMLIENLLLVATGIRQILEAEGDIRVTNIKTNCRTPCGQDCLQTTPDVLVMEPSLEKASGLDCMRRILARNPATHILAVSHDSHATTARHALSIGALGFVDKNASADELRKAVRTVAKGMQYFGRDVARHLIRRRFHEEANPFDALTRREHEVLLLMLAGKSATEISQLLSISAKTQANHHTHIMRKLEVRNMVELTRLAIRHGIIQAGLALSACLPELLDLGDWFLF